MSQFLSPFPKYLQIRQLLLRRIQQDFHPGQAFPTDKELMSEFGVSRETVREALNGLAEEGWIRRHRGQGTFVSDSLPQARSDRRISGFAEDLTELHADTVSKVLESGVIRVPSDIASTLQLRPNESTYKIVRVRYFEGAPLSYIETFVPIDIGERLMRIPLEHSSIMMELRKSLNVLYRETSQTIEAVAADAVAARALDVQVGAPLLLISRLLMLGDPERPMLFRSSFRSDRYFYTVQLGKAAPPSKQAPRRKVTP